MRECLHEHFDFKKTGGPGYVVCKDCGKSIPLERALVTLDHRIRNLERLTIELIKESRDEE